MSHPVADSEAQMKVKHCSLGMVCLLAVSVLHQSATAQSTAPSRQGRIALWDTGQPSLGRVARAPAERDSWERIDRGQTVPSFQGDAVMANGRILAILRKQGSAVDLYADDPAGGIWRASLRLLTRAGERAEHLDRVALLENTRSSARWEATYRTEGGATITTRLRIKKGGIAVELEPGPGAGRLHVESPGRYVVFPDFFADDILIDATKMPVPMIEAPSEHFLLHLTGDGDSIAMCVFENREQDVRVMFSGEGSQRLATGSEIHFGKERKIWVALMEAPQVWHTRTIAPTDAAKILPLDWTMPFAAQWRVDFTRRNDLIDSWEMLRPAHDGPGYVKPSWLAEGRRGSEPSRTATGEVDVDAYQVGGPASNRLGPDRQRWITFLGRYHYPCWTDEQGRGFLQPLKHKQLLFQGPAVIYPINRLPETPIDRYTTVDVVRDTLGVGPCEYLLDVERQRQDHVGRATCHVRRLLKEIYASQQQKAKRQEIETYLDDGLDFVTHIRQRIDQYIAFGRELRVYLAEQKKRNPTFAGPLAELDEIAGELDQRLSARREQIKSPEFVARLNDTFRENLLQYEGPDALKRLETYTRALTQVGGSQDGLVGECRWIVRTLRQRAALMMALDPAFAGIASEIRARTQEVLLKPSAYEGARH